MSHFCKHITGEDNAVIHCVHIDSNNEYYVEDRKIYAQIHLDGLWLDLCYQCYHALVARIVTDWMGEMVKEGWGRFQEGIDEYNRECNDGKE